VASETAVSARTARYWITARAPRTAACEGAAIREGRVPAARIGAGASTRPTRSRRPRRPLQGGRSPVETTPLCDLRARLPRTWTLELSGGGMQRRPLWRSDLTGCMTSLGQDGLVPLDPPTLENGSYSELAEEQSERIPVYTPEWTDHEASDPGITLLKLCAFLAEAMLVSTVVWWLVRGSRRRAGARRAAGQARRS
jgi:hypothetical protein